jgi:DNA polymerase-3 subunit epsilon
LASVYLELLGGRQPAFDLAAATGVAGLSVASAAQRQPRAPRPHGPTEEELAAHRAMLAMIKSPLWLAAASG